MGLGVECIFVGGQWRSQLLVHRDPFRVLRNSDLERAMWGRYSSQWPVPIQLIG